MTGDEDYRLSPGRQLTAEEEKLVWKRPLSHKVSEEERRISREIKRNWNRGEMKIANILLEGDAGSGKTQLAKALSANFGLPYTKVTCFADMDQSDLIGAILPVVSTDRLEKMEPVDQRALKALYESDGFQSATEILMEVLGIAREQAALQLKRLLKLAAEWTDGEAVQYRFYPSEIVRAYQKGYLLEIQEPNVIRDAAVLMALNSALELDGSINLPTEIVRRHPDFIAVITANRSYAGARPLNEALRDRVQHTEKMDLPTKEVMIERAMAKTGYRDETVLGVLADAIILLDKTARANAIKGVAGMRSYFYWADAVAWGASAKESLYHKVIYKITTDSEEIRLLEEALEKQGLFADLEKVRSELAKPKKGNDATEIRTWGAIDESAFEPGRKEGEKGIALKKSADSDTSATRVPDESLHLERSGLEGDGSPCYHPDSPETASEDARQRNRDFRKKLNRAAREVVSDSIHRNVRLIVHRPCPPTESPSLVVGLRIDESASMSAFGRLEAAKRAAIAVYEFCRICQIPILIYGDTADVSKLEQMSVFAYADFAHMDPDDRFRLMGIRARTNNRDGMALRIMAERLAASPQQTKLLISISDGQPKAMDDYTGSYAVADMQQTIEEYERIGITFLAAAIGQDKEVISEIYGNERFLDIANLQEFPAQLVRMIARYWRSS
ncbi:AAA family ATPase [Brevibacillus brevis]|uniref:AAA family ATPase n=1 Tax=Brevibacillus brevis TaxID=1393 RepID=A0ABY9T6G3_BREBE|nr:AAA family ATPase [Brevibacillus brevis]WNC15691.1 AAA family ATPase [Brevibacillus brevis]